ncbi:MAG: hypothetical protein ACRC4O_10860 [Giesbergeria sp.]
MITVIGKTDLSVGDKISWAITWRNALDGEAIESCSAALSAGSTGLTVGPLDRPDPSFVGMVSTIWVEATDGGAGTVDVTIETNKGLRITRAVRYVVAS